MKCAYMTLLTKEIYFPCVKRFNQRLKYLKSSYPFIVLITDNMDMKIIKLLEQENISYKIVPYLDLIKGQFKDIINEFYILTCTEFDRILFLDADILFCKHHIDEVFAAFPFRSEKLGVYYCSPPEDRSIQGCFGGFILCQPNKEFFNTVIDLIKNNYRDIFSDEKVLDLLLKYYPNEILILNPGFGPTPYVHGDNWLHFQFDPKMWTVTDSEFIKKFFYDYDAQTFNEFVNNHYLDLFKIKNLWDQFNRNCEQLL